jgi:hypothetical protein
MLSGKRFELTKPALALDSVVRQGWISIPAGAIIRVIAGPNGDGEQMIEVLWEDRMLAMYAIDVTAGCREITDGSATADGREKDDEGTGRRASAKGS